ncbi:oligoendopeptidase F [Suicoccus acidiformans]|uniref:Oligopeptidase F n=1 Tax=Suicoccus acidiformans TaxID=2036206 RepID=A0A347WJ53_9LACT|nr:oligoendopeptidase F [Suicoccus acidiformans]AXY25110.1 oligoendopeptidase F [Suicoccus acidiformans]
MVEIKQREAMDPAYQWDLSSVFESDETFELSLESLKEQLPEVTAFKGRLSESPEVLADAIDTLENYSRQLHTLYVYTSLKRDQDQGNDTYQRYEAQASQLLSEYAAATSFFQPELLAIDPEELEDFIRRSERLQFYRHYLEDATRQRKHVLSPAQEKLLAQAREVLSAHSDTFSLLNNADLSFGTIKDEAGQEVPLTHGSYSKYMESTDRRVRRDAFEGLYAQYEQFKNTFASLVSTQMKSGNFRAKARHYDSARQAALDSHNISEDVYDTLVDTVNEALPLLHEYVALRKDMLGLDTLEMYDMYTPLLGDPPISFTYDEAKDVVLKALAPLGSDYTAILTRAFDEKWIDVYENKGKRSGAYSSGSYDTKPYILMNWQDGLNSLYTLVHELGHSVHSELSNTHQAYVYSNYPIFLAEIASTTNENLLTQYLLDTYQDKETQAYVLNHFLDGVKGTVFRQTQFAEFEHFMYTQEAAGEPLTAQFLSKHYQELNAKYYGSSVNSDSQIALEWARIPHFYYNYYVYQYATGFSAATYFAQGILKGEAGMLESYVNFLKSGSKDYPIAIMQEAGLDMTQTDYIQATLNAFNERLQAFKAL